jgi:cytochrome c556
MIRSLFMAGAIALAATTVVAQQNPIETRQNIMKRQDDDLKVLNAMVKGQAPFDAGKVSAIHTGFADGAAKLRDLFPDDSQTGNKTRASPKIWENRSDFDAKLADFTKAIADAKAQSATADGAKTGFENVVKACDNCHQTYRLRRQS